MTPIYINLKLVFKIGIMNILIVYDSLYGNTAKLAQQIARSFHIENVRLLSVSETTATDLSWVHLLIIGSPTHNGRSSVATTQLLRAIPAGSMATKRVAVFSSGIPVEGHTGLRRLLLLFSGYADRHIVKLLKKSGANIIGAEPFYVTGKEGPLREGELQRCQQWIENLVK